MAFEPFYAYELIDEKMAGDLWEGMRSYRQRLNDFIEDDEPNVEKCRELMRTMEEIDDLHKDVSEEIYRIPSIIHIAGEYKEETNPDDDSQTAMIQRCSRCGSLLQFWYDGMMYLSDRKKIEPLEENETRWWDVGQMIGKHDIPGATDLYAIKEGRDLERWEHECVDMSGLENILDVQE